MRTCPFTLVLFASLATGTLACAAAYADESQSIRNLAKRIGPEAAMDMMFSSIDPICQHALLIRSTEKGKTPYGLENMRDNKYLTPAIATSDETIPPIKPQPASATQPAVPNWMNPGNYFNWIRINPGAGLPNTSAEPSSRY